MSAEASERLLLAAALRAHAARRRAMGVTRIERGGEGSSAGARAGSAGGAHPPPPPPAREDRAEEPAVALRGAETSVRPETPGVAEPRGPAAKAGRQAREPASPKEDAKEPLPPGRPADLAPGCADLVALRDAVAGCRACALCETRTQTVFADGPLENGGARVMFIGEAPGFHEDRQGVPFVGQAGALLTDIITKGMKLRREDVVIANVLKCRPPDNRDPRADEKALCTPWLDRQIELVDPTVLIPLGRHAANHVLGTDLPMGRLRGRVHDAKGRKVVPTYHPAYLLRSPGDKRLCWQDIQLAMGLLGLQT